jgi:gas vesicle structural protein
VTDRDRHPLEQQVTLIELVDRVLNRGVVLSGDITLSVAGVDLVYVGLRVLLASVGTLERLEQGASGNGNSVLAAGGAER